MKDITLPRLYTALRDTLAQGGWVVTHSDPADTFVAMVSPCGRIRCVLHYMHECRSVYPNGSWTLKLNTDEGTWTVETDSRAISEDPKPFIDDYTRLNSISVILKDQIKKDVF